MCPSKDRLSTAVVAAFDETLHSFDNLLVDTITIERIHLIGGDGFCKLYVNKRGTRLARHLCPVGTSSGFLAPVLNEHLFALPRSCRYAVWRNLWWEK